MRSNWLIALLASAVVVVLVAVALVVVPSLSGVPSGSLTSNIKANAASPIIVSSVTPRPGASSTRANATIRITFSTPLSVDTPMPSISPSLSGRWYLADSTTIEFAPAQSFVPGDSYQITIPGGSGGVKGSRGQHLVNAESSSFTMASGSMLRLQQLLAGLDYLPYGFHPSGAKVPAVNDAQPQAGSFSLRWTNTPATLEAGWQAGSWNVVTQAAIMSFERIHKLTLTSTSNTAPWQALLSASQNHQL
ncbi:MAG: Ig-like domain-containing domain, partial [Ferrimicrobium sp.]